MKVWAAALLIMLTGCASHSRFDDFQRIAQERYGPRAAQSAAELASLMESLEQQKPPIEIKLRHINDFFNSRILFRDDPLIWQQSDYWASPLETMEKGAGDCEDFVIAKFATLRLLDIPTSRLRLTYVKLRIGGPDSRVSQAHMVLSYYASSKSAPLVLDNIVGDIRPADQRPDLTPVFSFNHEDIWAGDDRRATQYDPQQRMSRWREAWEKTLRDGF